MSDAQYATGGGARAKRVEERGTVQAFRIRISQKSQMTSVPALQCQPPTVGKTPALAGRLRSISRSDFDPTSRFPCYNIKMAKASVPRGGPKAQTSGDQY